MHFPLPFCHAQIAYCIFEKLTRKSFFPFIQTFKIRHCIASKNPITFIINYVLHHNTECQFILALSFAVGDAESLHFEDDSFDLYTIAFGIRNVTHIDKVCYFLFSNKLCSKCHLIFTTDHI